MYRSRFKSKLTIFLSVVCIASVLVGLSTARGVSASAGSSEIDGLTSTKLANYTQLLKYTYLQDSAGLAKFNETDLKFAENEVGSIRQGYTDYGMSINDASVESSVQSVKTANNVTSVRALISTTIQYTEPAVSGVPGIQKSKWDDNHEISFNQFDTKDNKIGVQNDITLPDSDTAPTTPDAITAPKGAPIAPDAIAAPKGAPIAPDLEGRRDNSARIRTAGARPSYDTTAAIAYALKWTSGANDGDKQNQFNPSYPFYDDNCANFVSQALHEGGVNYAKDYLINYKDDDSWAYYGFGKASYTWGGAANNYQYMRNHSGLFRDETRSFSYLGEGSLIYADWDADGSINHVALVTSAPRIGVQDDGVMLFMPHITQKSTSRHDIPWSAYLPIANKQHSKIKWYALAELWIPLPGVK